MGCRQCFSEHQRRLSSEIAVHVPYVKTPHVLLFPVLLVCLNYGFTEFVTNEPNCGRLSRVLLLQRRRVRRAVHDTRTDKAPTFENCFHCRQKFPARIYLENVPFRSVA